MRKVRIEDATAPLSEYARAMDGEPLVITTNGKAIAVLVPTTDADLETVTLSTHTEFLELIERSRARQRLEGGIPSDEMRRRLGLDPAPAEKPRRRVR